MNIDTDCLVKQRIVFRRTYSSRAFMSHCNDIDKIRNHERACSDQLQKMVSQNENWQ